MSIHITADEARELLTRAVEEKGADYVYPRSSRDVWEGCVYFEGDAPSCIVGHILAYKGMPPLDYDLNISVVEVLANDGVIDVDPQTLGALGMAQGKQDAGGTWGEALAAAEAVLDNDDWGARS